MFRIFNPFSKLTDLELRLESEISNHAETTRQLNELIDAHVALLNNMAEIDNYLFAKIIPGCTLQQNRMIAMSLAIKQAGQTTADTDRLQQRDVDTIRLSIDQLTRKRAN